MLACCEEELETLQEKLSEKEEEMEKVSGSLDHI